MLEIIPNAISPATVRSVAASWPNPDWSGWHRYNNATSNKFGSLHHSLIPRACLKALDELADLVSPMLGDSFIDYDLHAAGMHMLPPGGFLGRHLDAVCHPSKPWIRTHSIVLCCNTLSAAEEPCGGELLIDGHPPIPTQENTAVVFETQDVWHEVTPVSYFAQYRKTLALFAWREQGICLGPSSATFI